MGEPAQSWRRSPKRKSLTGRHHAAASKSSILRMQWPVMVGLGHKLTGRNRPRSCGSVPRITIGVSLRLAALAKFVGGGTAGCCGRFRHRARSDEVGEAVCQAGRPARGRWCFDRRGAAPLEQRAQHFARLGRSSTIRHAGQVVQRGGLRVKVRRSDRSLAGPRRILRQSVNVKSG